MGRNSKVLAILLVLVLALQNMEPSLSMASDVLVDVTSPIEPLNLDYLINEDSKITLTWNMATDNVGVTGYDIYRNTEKIGTTSDNFFIDNIENHTVTHEYYIVAFDEAGNSSLESNHIIINSEPVVSNEVINETKSIPAPSDLAYSIQTDNSLILLWSEISDNIVGFEIYRDGTLIGYTETSNYTDMELSAGMTYTYSIVACDALGNKSNHSETVSVALEKNEYYDDFTTYKTDRFIVKYKDEEGSSKLKGYLNDKINSSYKVKNRKYKNIEVIILNEKVVPDDFFTDMKGKNKNKDTFFNFATDIEFIHPDYEFTASSADAYFDQQWGIYNTGINANNQLTDPQDVIINDNKITMDINSPLLLLDNPIDIPDETVNEVYTPSVETNEYRIDSNVTDAWIQTKGEGVFVAVIDTGIDITQEDLRDNIWVNTAEIPDNYIDDDGNGYVDDINGWDFVDESNQVHSLDYIHDEWHGTHIAGIIAAQDNNDLGITGVAPDAKILPLKVFQNGVAYTSDIIAAIEYAELMGVKIVNCSWGSSENNQALKEAIDYSNMLFVCAAGNSHQNLDKHPIYPASYDSNNVISVAAINESGILTGFTNYGENSVDIAAPGENIISTVPENRYITTSGTSMAAAFVSAGAALILSLNKNFNTYDVRDRIITTADKLSSLNGKVLNGNKINCNSAIQNIISNEIIKVQVVDDNNYSEYINNPQTDYSLYANGSWQSVANYPNPTMDFSAVSLNGKIYAGGGFSESKLFYEYDPSTNSWTQKADLLYGRSKHVMAVVNGKIYAIGGSDSRGYQICKIEEYNPSTNIWSYKTEKYVDFSYSCVAVLNNIIYLIGGGAYCLYAYDPVTNSLTQKANMVERRAGAQAAVINGKIYVYGGINYWSSGLNSMEMYDPITDSWTFKASMSTPRCFFGSGAVGGKFYAIGGYGNYTTTNTVEEYSPTLNSWSYCPNMPIIRSYFPTTVLNNGIYTICGSSSNGLTASVQVYMPQIDDIGNEFIDSIPVQEETETSGMINYSGDIDCFKFIPIQSCQYDIFTASTMDSYGELYNSSGTLISYNDNYNTDINFRLSPQLQAGQTYYIKVKHSSTGSGSYRLRVVKALTAPANIKFSVNSDSINITWNSVQNITGYDIEVNGAVYDCGLNLSYVHNSPENNKAHTYRVRTKTNLTSSPWSNRIYASTLGSPWQIVSNMPEDRVYFGVTNVNGKIYAIGGYSDRSGTGKVYDSVFEYDIVTNAWKTLAKMNVARHSLSVTTVNGKIYAIGGVNVNGMLSTVEEFDPEKGMWVLKASMPTARMYAGISVINDKIYVVGGWNGSTYLTTVEVYDPLSNIWTTKKPMNTPRLDLALATVNNKLYAIGGGNESVLNIVEEYDPITDTWTTKANLPTARYGLSAAAVGNLIYAIGGVNGPYLNTVEVYSPDTDTWATKESKLVKAYRLEVTAVGGKIYALGGYNDYGCLSSVETYSAEVISYEYVYDANNSLKEIKKNGQTIVTFFYDKNGNLILTQSSK